MSSNLGSLGDLFREQGKDVKCRIRGCNNLVHISGERALRNKTGGHPHQEGLMCDECRAYFLTLEDRQMPCSKPGCDGTWTWNRYQQLEAHVQGRDSLPPRGFCEKCRGQLKEHGDIAQPCRVKGCKGTWLWTARMQMESTDGKPPRRLCDDCFKIYRDLHDRELPCRIKGCSHVVLWTRMQQLEHLRSGKSLDNPPSRMCPECMKRFNELKPQEVPCRVQGCRNTWTWNAYDQLEALLATPEGQKPEPPKRMCKECMNYLNSVHDVEVPCANKGCAHVWIWTRGMQLNARLTGHDAPPHRICDHCREAIKALQPIENPCAVEGCHGKWIYTPEQQLRDQLARRRPEPRFCTKCQEFLAGHKAERLVCEKCGKEFVWSAREQLYTELGTFQKPRFCAECNSRELSAIPAPREVITRAVQPRLRITIPTGGEWNGFAAIRDWPEGMTNDAIAMMENAIPRVVCIGDEMTAAGPDEPSWVRVLSGMLQEKHPQCGVINSGMAGTTAELLNMRFARDVAPFAPHLVVFSTAFADTRRPPEGGYGEEAVAAVLAAKADQFGQFVEKCRSLDNPPELLCWLPNPIFPQKDGRNGQWRLNDDPDVEAVRYYDGMLRAMRSWCQAREVALVDGKALFEIVGQKTAMSWMADCFRPNADGCRNLAGWMLGQINGKSLL